MKIPVLFKTKALKKNEKLVRFKAKQETKEKPGIEAFVHEEPPPTRIAPDEAAAAAPSKKQRL